MKKVFKAIGNFFKKIGLFIWKYLKICWNYIKDNAWIQPIAVVVLIFGLVFGFQAIVEAIDEAKVEKQQQEEDSTNLATQVTFQEVREKIKNKEDFILFWGSSGCAACKDIKNLVLNNYIEDSGNTIYYLEAESLSTQEEFDEVHKTWVNELHSIPFREYESPVYKDGKPTGEYKPMDSLSTPTLIIVRDGEFKDARVGTAKELYSGDEGYFEYIKFLNGDYIGIESPK